MCEVVEISDDEDSFVLENDVGIVPKEENLNYDSPPQNTCSGPGVDDVASSSRNNLRSSFIGMGFASTLVDKAIEENGDENAELLLETLFAYSDLQTLKTEVSDDAFSGGNDNLAANPRSREAFHKPESLDSMFAEGTNMNAHYKGDIHLKVELDVGSEVGEEIMASLLKMNFSLDEVGFAMHRLGKHASIGQLMDFIFAARMAKKYEKDPNIPFPGKEETEKDCKNEALFGIMEKTLQLLEMGFTENEISAAFEKCGSEAPVPELADSIVTAGTGPNTDKYSSTSFSNLSFPRNCQSLKRKMEDSDSLCIKTEEFSLDVASQVGTSDLLGKLKGKMPNEVHNDEPNNWKKPKEEFTEEDSSNSVGRMWLKARRGNYTSTNNPVAALQRQAGHIGSLEEDIKPTLPISNPCRSLNSVVAKPPYFLYGNVTNLSHDSWVKISQFLYSVQPEFVNCQLYSALNRKEGYVHNLPTEDRFRIFSKGPTTIEEAYKLAPPEPEDLERIMGYPVHHTRVAGLSSAERLKSLKLSFQTDTLGYHLSVLRRLFPGGITVLSFFSGIGGAEVALHRLGIRLKGVVSVEPCEAKRKIVKKWWENSVQRGELIQFESIHKLSGNKLDDLFKKFRGFDLVICQNPYSGVDSDSLAGLDFSMFVEFVRLLQRVRSTMERNR